MSSDKYYHEFARYTLTDHTLEKKLLLECEEIKKNSIKSLKEDIRKLKEKLPKSQNGKLGKVVKFKPR